jgi:hypothetical protein
MITHSPFLHRAAQPQENCALPDPSLLRRTAMRLRMGNLVDFFDGRRLFRRLGKRSIRERSAEKSPVASILRALRPAESPQAREI